MAKKIKVENKPDLVRDSHSKAIINVDRANYAAARARKKMLLQKEETIESLKSDINQLQKDYAALLVAVSKLSKTLV